MKPEQLYHELRNAADRLGLIVLEHNFRTTGIHVKSGYCKVRNQDHCIIDKHLKAGKKAEILAECLTLLPHESIYILPAAREYLDAIKPRGGELDREPLAHKGQGQSEST
jgi:hypothetical protein